MIQIYNEDCLKAMKEMPDDSFDLAIVDPPYGLNISVEGGTGGGVLAKKSKYTSKSWDSKAPDESYFKELKRVSKHQIIWGANHFIELIPHANSSSWLVWNKKNGNNNFADCELAYTSFKSAVRMFEYRWQGMLQENMKHKEQRIHPTQKPVSLYSWILSNYAKKGDRILDTHLGSGSSAIAAHDMDFDFVGYELDKDYFAAAQERLHEHQKQLKLFVG